MLPQKVRDLMRWHPSLQNELDVRKQFTRAVVLWNDHYEFVHERDEAIKIAREKYENKVKHDHRDWFLQMQQMDKVMSYW